jgi:hypothetical protein
MPVNCDIHFNSLLLPEKIVTIMPHAILITAYKNIAHLKRIVHALRRPEFYFFIHIDKKSRLSGAELKELQEIPNVKLVSQKYRVNWGSVEHLKTILFLSRMAFEECDSDYFHLITGHDFPLKSPDRLCAFFERNKGKEFLTCTKLPHPNWKEGGLNRILYYHAHSVINGKSYTGKKIAGGFVHLQKILGIKRRFPKDFPALYGGGTYWSLSRECIGYIFDYLHTHPQFLKCFDYTFCAEEIFFQTIVMNSPLKENTVNDNLRFILWEERNGNLPANLDETDYPAIAASNAMFARRFEYPVSETLLKKIEAEIMTG